VLTLDGHHSAVRTFHIDGGRFRRAGTGAIRPGALETDALENTSHLDLRPVAPDRKGSTSTIKSISLTLSGSFESSFGNGGNKALQKFLKRFRSRQRHDRENLLDE